jgi:Sulfotransferase domain
MSRRVSIAIVGAPKCATTSLLRYLGQHPELYDHPQAECDFFLNAAEYERGWDYAQERYYPKDPGPPARLVAKRAVMLYDRDSLGRLSAHNPSVVVTALLRNPVDRAYSAYSYARLRGWQKPEPFEAAVEAELDAGLSEDVDPHGPGGYLSTGVYVWHVRRLLEIFAAERVHLFTTDEISEARGESPVWRTLFEAAGVDPDFVPEHEVRHNVGAKPRSERVAQMLASKSGPMGFVRRVTPERVLDRARRMTSAVIAKSGPLEGIEPETRKALELVYEPYNRELEELLGRPTSWTAQSPRSRSAPVAGVGQKAE